MHIVLLVVVLFVGERRIDAKASLLRPNQNNDIYVLQRSGAQIVAVSGFLNCDALMCPWLSIFCYVQRDTLDSDSRLIRRLRVCMTRDGEELFRVVGFEYAGSDSISHCIAGIQTKIRIDNKSSPTPNAPFHDRMKNYE